MLSFAIKGVQTSMVSAAIYDSRKALVKITISPAKLNRDFYWIRKFKKDNRDKEIKGILVRRSKSDDKTIEIRLRYLMSINPSARDQVEFREDATGVTVSVPRRFTQSATSADATTSTGMRGSEVSRSNATSARAAGSSKYKGD